MGTRGDDMGRAWGVASEKGADNSTTREMSYLGAMLARVYAEVRAPLSGCVLWTRSSAAVPSRHRVLPDGCLDLIAVDGTLLVAGPDTVAHLVDVAAGESYTGLRMGPGIGPTVLGVPAATLLDRVVPLDTLWPAAAVRRAAGRLATADPATVLVDVAAGRLARAEPDPVMRAAARWALAGRPVATIADATGLSARHLHRRCQFSFGYGLKTLSRIGRLDRALSLARTGLPLARAAADAGYADQPHFTREVRALAGVPPARLLAV
jgi:AraC-like DNA-binding protein